MCLTCSSSLRQLLGVHVGSLGLSSLLALRRTSRGSCRVRFKQSRRPSTSSWCRGVLSFGHSQYNAFLLVGFDLLQRLLQVVYEAWAKQSKIVLRLELHEHAITLRDVTMIVY